MAPSPQLTTYDPVAMMVRGPKTVFSRYVYASWPFVSKNASFPVIARPGAMNGWGVGSGTRDHTRAATIDRVSTGAGVPGADGFTGQGG